MKRSLLVMLLMALPLASQAQAASSAVDPGIQAYQSVSGVSGNVNSIGSDTLNNLMTFWAEGFKAVYPNVNVQIEGKGSSTAPPALIEGTAELGPMSRAMKSDEEDRFEKKFGYKPTAVKTAVDSLAVFVHKDNPVQCLGLQQLDSVFSSTYKRGGANIATWGQLGLTGPWKDKPISLYGRNSASGTYGFFKSEALKEGDYKPTVKEQPGSSSVVQGVASDLAGIGYSGVGYKTAGVKALPLKGEGESCYEPSFENSLAKKYPLTRVLYVYINKHPGKEPSKLVGEFLKFVLSKQGQEIVIKDGYYPLPAKLVADEMTRLK